MSTASSSTTTTTAWDTNNIQSLTKKIEKLDHPNLTTEEIEAIVGELGQILFSLDTVNAKTNHQRRKRDQYQTIDVLIDKFIRQLILIDRSNQISGRVVLNFSIFSNLVECLEKNFSLSFKYKPEIKNDSPNLFNQLVKIIFLPRIDRGKVTKKMYMTILKSFDLFDLEVDNYRIVPQILGYFLDEIYWSNDNVIKHPNLGALRTRLSVFSKLFTIQSNNQLTIPTNYQENLADHLETILLKNDYFKEFKSLIIRRPVFTKILENLEIIIAANIQIKNKLEQIKSKFLKNVKKFVK